MMVMHLCVCVGGGGGGGVNSMFIVLMGALVCFF